MNAAEPHSLPSRRRFIAAVAGATLAGGGFALTKFFQPEIALAETSQEVRAKANEVLARLEKLQDDLDVKATAYQEALAEEEEAEAKIRERS